MMKSIVAKTGIGLLGATLLIGGGVAGYGFTQTERADCPGRITCPITGDEVCRDQCPLVETDSDATAKEIAACCRAKN